MTTVPSDPSKLALIIGIDSYRSEGLEDLPSCKKDVEDLNKLLPNLGYTIFGERPIIGSELNEPHAWVKIHTAIRDFFKGAKPHQILMFYFSGHGLQREDEIFLAMPEVDPKDPIVEGYSLSTLTRLMNSSKSMKIVSIIDACYSGAARLPDSKMKDKAVKAKETAGHALATYDRVLDNIPKIEGRCFLLSSQAYQSSLAIPNNNSLYTKYLIEGLSGTELSNEVGGGMIPASVDDNGNVTPETLHRYIYHKVANEAAQVPKIKYDRASDIVLAEHPQLATGPKSSVDVSDIIDLGRTYFDNEDFDNALRSFSRAIVRNPKSSVAHNYKGDVFFKQGKYNEAIECYNQALQINPKYFDVLKDKGYSYHFLEMYNEAIECYDQALEIASKSQRKRFSARDLVQLWYYKGFALAKLAKYDEAINSYSEALDINPKEIDALQNKGLALFNLSRYDDAIKCYEAALEIDPISSKIWYYKGLALSNLSRYDEAIMCYDEALKINSEYGDALRDRRLALARKVEEQEEESKHNKTDGQMPSTSENIPHLSPIFPPATFPETPSTGTSQRPQQIPLEFDEGQGPPIGGSLKDDFKNRDDSDRSITTKQSQQRNLKILIPIIIVAAVGTIIAFAVFNTTTTTPTPPDTTTTTTPTPPDTTTTTTPTPHDIQPPTRVTGLSVMEYYGTKFGEQTIPSSQVNLELEWTKNPIEDKVSHYNVYIGTTPEFPVTPGTTSPRVTPSYLSSFSDHDVNPSTTYYYKVAAVDDAGNIGPLSSEVSATPTLPNTTTTTPATPTTTPETTTTTPEPEEGATEEVPAGGESETDICDNTIDDDGDGLVDTEDIEDCPAPEQQQQRYTFVRGWGSYGTGDGQFDFPRCVAIDSTDNVYVADTGNDRVQKFDSDSNFIATWGSEGSGDGQFDAPWGIAFDSSDNVYVADSINDRIQKFDSDGNFISEWGSNGNGDGQFRAPKGIAIDSMGIVYVTDIVNDRVQKFGSGGNFIATWGSEGTGDGQFDTPEGITVDSSDNVYVADNGNNRIQKFDSDGNFIATWGSEGTGDGQFDAPKGITVDSTDNVYVVDGGSNDHVQKFDSDGNFITKLGSPGTQDGQFNFPGCVAVDSSGSVYIADSLNDRIQVFSQN